MTPCVGLRGTRFLATAVAAAALQTSCGGGVGEALVLSFLGTGGGQFVLEPRPVPAGYEIRADSMTLSLTNDGGGTTQPDLYASGYNINVLGSPTGRLLACRNATGRVEGSKVTIAGCFSGSYENINRIVSDDSTRALYHVFDPNLTTGLWVDINDPSRAIKFSSVTQACEYTGGTKRAATVVRRDASLTQAQAGQPFTLVTSGIAAMAVSGSSTWTGEFVGISGLRLTSGNSRVELQRRNQAPPSPCP